MSCVLLPLPLLLPLLPLLHSHCHEPYEERVIEDVPWALLLVVAVVVVGGVDGGEGRLSHCTASLHLLLLRLLLLHPGLHPDAVVAGGGGGGGGGARCVCCVQLALLSQSYHHHPFARSNVTQKRLFAPLQQKWRNAMVRKRKQASKCNSVHFVVHHYCKIAFRES